MPIIAVTKANSATTSRLAVPSIEFSAGSREPQVERDGCRVEAERGPGERSPAVGRDIRSLRPVDEPLEIAGQRPRVGEQVVGEEHGLGVLQVRAAGHDRGAVRVGLCGERVDEVHELLPDRRRHGP